MNRCVGLNANLKRCGRSGEWRFFCSDHSRQWLVWLSFIVFTVIAGSASIYSLFPLHLLVNEEKLPSYSDFSSQDIPAQVELCKQNTRISDPIYADICNYYSRSTSKLKSISRAKEDFHVVENHIKMVTNGTKDSILDGLKKNYQRPYLKIKPLSYDFLSEQCQKDEEFAKFLHGAMLSLGYYSSFRKLLMSHKESEPISGVDTILPEPNHLNDYYLAVNKENTKSLIIKPSDFITSGLFELSDLVAVIDSLSKKDKEALSIFLNYTLKYRDIYRAAKKRLIMDREFDSFIEDTEYGLVYASERNHIDLNQYGFIEHPKCFSGFAYMNFEYLTEVSFWPFYPHEYLTSFWLRRDLQGSTFLTSSAIKLSLSYLQ